MLSMVEFQFLTEQYNLGTVWYRANKISLIYFHKWNEEEEEKLKGKKKNLQILIYLYEWRKLCSIAKKVAKKVISEVKNKAFEYLHLQFNIKEGERHIYRIAKVQKREQGSYPNKMR